MVERTAGDSVNQIGYFGIVVPTYNLFQGCFLYQDSTIVEIADRMVETVASVKGGVEVIDKYAGLSVEDHPLVGSMSSLVIEGFTKNQNELLAPAAFALSRILGRQFFFVRGDIEKRGIRTFVENMPNVTSVDGARDFINRHPDVIAVQKRLFDEQVARAKEGKLGKHDA